MSVCAVCSMWLRAWGVQSHTTWPCVADAAPRGLPKRQAPTPEGDGRLGV